MKDDRKWGGTVKILVYSIVVNLVCHNKDIFETMLTFFASDLPDQQELHRLA